MNRVIHDLAQGGAAWHQHRRTHLNASDAPAMMGVSPYVSRSDLVKAHALGIEREVSPQDQARFDDGHAYEAMARPWAEELLGEDLFPIVASLDVNGLPLSASFDGTTIAGDVIFEHKTLNQELAAALPRGEIPECYKPQLEQQLLILDADRCLFMASNGDRETMKCAWYVSDPALRARLIAGWRQFVDDVANYQHVEVIPKAVASPTRDLPAVAIEAKGEVSIHSNLERFGEGLRAFIAAIPAKPATDQEFADCEAAVKSLKLAEERLEAAEASALARFDSIDELRRTCALYRELARDQRLAIDKLVKARKDEIRSEILQCGVGKFAEHVAKLNTRLGKPYMPTLTMDFVGAMRGKKTVASLRDAVATELARMKIHANEVADRIQVNVNLLNQQDPLLFPDAAALVLKAPDDFAAQVELRKQEHLKRLEAGREKIRAEEAARLATPSIAPAGRAMPEPTVRVVKTARPTDDEIITALATHFKVPEGHAIAWLLDMDLEEAKLRIKQFAA